jgi:queuine tRNA-ribosyltransferase
MAAANVRRWGVGSPEWAPPPFVAGEQDRHENDGMKPGLRITLEAADGAARAGTLTTWHGSVPTPLFMPVATLASVKGVDIGRVRETGAGMVLANTYHLHLRPGEAVVEQGGGVAKFMGWGGPTLTDSGGFQVFSLAKQVRVTEEGAFFRSHLDGAAIDLTPEAAVRIQERLGADVAMQLDEVVALPAERDHVESAMRRSLRWAERCLAARARPDQAMFGIVQGGLDPELRQESAESLRRMPFEGYAVGGLSVGEGPEAMVATLRATVPHLPSDKPRYLMGVGQPQDIVEAVAAGIDMFDCVLPTRCGRNSLVYTFQGQVRLRNACHATDQRPLEEGCPCLACRHSRSYIRHLFLAGEMLGPILASIHNLTFYQRLVSRLRQAIVEGRFAAERGELLPRFAADAGPEVPG